MKRLLTVLGLVLALRLQGAGTMYVGTHVGDGSGLTNVSTAGLALSSRTNHGLQSLTNFNLGQVYPGWLDGQERMPRRVIELVAAESIATNFIIATLNPSGAKTNGFKWVEHDTETWQLPSQGNPVRDATTHLVLWNTNNFPDGPVGYFTFLKTNGLAPSLWYDSFWMNTRFTNAYLMANDVSNAVQWAAAAGVDINFRIDMGSQMESLYEFPIVLQAVQNAKNVSFMAGLGQYASALGGDYDVISPFLFSYAGSGVRIHGPQGDILHNYNYLMQMIPFIETNGIWKYTMPGRFSFVGGCNNSNFGTNAAAYSAAMRHEYHVDNTDPALTAFAGAGAVDILAIQGDAACIPSRIALVTNGTYVLIGPLGGASGPDYSLALFNTNTTTATFDLAFSGLYKWLAESSYITRDCFQRTQSLGATNILSISLPATNAALYRLISVASRDGRALTNLNSTNLIGTINQSRLPTTVLTNGGSLSGDGTGITNRPIAIFSDTRGNGVTAGDAITANTWTRVVLQTTNYMSSASYFRLTTTNTVLVLPGGAGILWRVKWRVPIYKGNHHVSRLQVNGSAVPFYGSHGFSDTGNDVETDTVADGVTSFASGDVLSLDVACNQAATIGLTQVLAPFSVYSQISFERQ